MDSSIPAPGVASASLPAFLRLVDAAFLLAVAVPTLLAFNLPPSSTFFNQAAALAGWGALLAGLGKFLPWPGLTLRRELLLLLIPLALLASTAAWSMGLRDLPSSIGLSSIGMMLAAALVMIAGASVRQSIHARIIFRALCVALVVAGICGVAIGSVQVFAPDLADGNVIATVAVGGRASGNLRQPNHLSSLLIWAVVALAWLWQARTVPAAVGGTLGVVLVFGIVLTGSRTGTVDVLVLAAWGLLDRKAPRALRAALILAPIIYALAWWGLTEWAHATSQVFGGEGRLSTEGDISSSRYAIWANTLSLIVAHPWFGVGFGEFNFAWSLTPFPHRPVAFFDHTHNLLLQFAVELGVPLALAIAGLLLAALWFALRAGLVAKQPMSSMLRAGFMMVLMIGIHSMLEYPLWYSYFLLPTAFAFGFCLGRDADTPGEKAVAGVPTLASGPRSSLVLPALALVLVVGAAVTVVDYLRVSAIFTADEAAPLAQRIERGRHSLFFTHHADYAAVTTLEHPSKAMLSFGVATHNLLDTRLMMAWARAYAELGDLDRARHIAMRLREFRNEDSAEFFAECSRVPDGTAPPFQCSEPARALGYPDFR